MPSNKPSIPPLSCGVGPTASMSLITFTPLTGVRMSSTRCRLWGVICLRAFADTYSDLVFEFSVLLEKDDFVRNDL